MKLLFPVIMAVGANISAIAQEPEVMNGSTHLISKEYDSLSINGALTFDDLIVKNLLIVNGRIQGKSLKCTTLNSNGSIDVNGLQAQNVKSHGAFVGENIYITDEAKLRGSIKITNGKLNKIRMLTTQATFINVEVSENVIFEKVSKGCDVVGFPSNQSLVQVLELKGKSLIIGDIIFEDKGEVHVFDQSKIKGKVINAKVVSKTQGLPDDQES